MAQIQALLLTCPDVALESSFADFVENELNLYAVNIQTFPNATKIMYEGGLARDEIFSDMENLIRDQEIPQIIIIGHSLCPTRPEKEKDDSELEIELRHVVSGLHTKFQQTETYAYLKNTEDKFIKII